MTTKVRITNVEGPNDIAIGTTDKTGKANSNDQRVKPDESVDLYVHSEQDIKVVELPC